MKGIVSVLCPTCNRPASFAWPAPPPRGRIRCPCCDTPLPDDAAAWIRENLGG